MIHTKTLRCDEGPNWVLTCSCGNRWECGRIRPVKKRGKWLAL